MNFAQLRFEVLQFWGQNRNSNFQLAVVTTVRTVVTHVVSNTRAAGPTTLVTVVGIPICMYLWVQKCWCSRVIFRVLHLLTFASVFMFHGCSSLMFQPRGSFNAEACAHSFFFVQYFIRVVRHIQDCGARSSHIQDCGACDSRAGIPICTWLWVIHFAVVRPICVVELQENASGMYLTSIFVNVESTTNFRIARAVDPTELTYERKIHSLTSISLMNEKCWCSSVVFRL